MRMYAENMVSIDMFVFTENTWTSVSLLFSCGTGIERGS